MKKLKIAEVVRVADFDAVEKVVAVKEKPMGLG